MFCKNYTIYSITTIIYTTTITFYDNSINIYTEFKGEWVHFKRRYLTFSTFASLQNGRQLLQTIIYFSTSKFFSVRVDSLLEWLSPSEKSAGFTKVFKMPENMEIYPYQ